MTRANSANTGRKRRSSQSIPAHVKVKRPSKRVRRPHGVFYGDVPAFRVNPQPPEDISAREIFQFEFYLDGNASGASNTPGPRHDTSEDVVDSHDRTVDDGGSSGSSAALVDSYDARGPVHRNNDSAAPTSNTAAVVPHLNQEKETVLSGHDVGSSAREELVPEAEFSTLRISESDERTPTIRRVDRVGSN